MPALATDSTAHDRPFTLFPSPGRDRGAALRVEREDIEFFNVAPGRVHIQVTVHNHGHMPSDPAPIDVEVAAFGAFLPWVPLTRLQAPPIEPGGSVTVHTEVDQARLDALTAASGQPPRPLLRAPGGFELPDDDARRRALSNRQSQILSMLARFGLRLGSEPMTSRSHHWIGNLNIFIGERPVERHVARALRIYPGKKNLAMFRVGSSSDQYSFSVDATSAEVRLHQFGRNLRRNPELVIPLEQWISMRSAPLVALEMDIAESLKDCSVTVHVRQRSTNAEAVVEFSMDAEARGPGCYVI